MKLVVVCGATATGKSELAFEMAKRLQTEIISFDSVQVYRHMNIGTAKPDSHVLSAIKHHLIDEVEPDQVFTAGDFRRKALEILGALEKKHQHVVLVGGTGFYLQALLKGMYDLPPISCETKMRLQEELKTRGRHEMYEELRTRDPSYAQRVHPQDTYRIVRALEILHSGSLTVTEIRQKFDQFRFPYPVVQIGMKRKKDVLRLRIERRTEEMLKQGLLAETKDLLERYGEVRPLFSVGYREAVAWLKGQLPEDQIPSAIVKSTMELAKRQTTWFKRDEQIQWYDPDQEGSLIHLSESLVDLVCRLA